MNRKEVLEEVEELMAIYCDGCFLHKYHCQEKGRRFAHRFYIRQCTVGEKIKTIGQKLIQKRGNS